MADLKQGIKWLCLAGALCGSPDAMTAEQFTDFVTGEAVSQQELERKKDFGVRLEEAIPGGIAARAGIRKGDVVLAVNGLRCYGRGEMALARHATATNGSFTFTIARQGDIVNAVVVGMKSDLKIGVRIRDDPVAFSRLLDSHSVKLEKPARAALWWMPDRATAELADWAVRNPEALQTNDGWLREFIALRTALVNQDYASAEKPTKAIPIPFFRRLSLFYLSVAERNRNGEKEPDWRVHGESLDFYCLFYPYPRLVPPDPGKFSCSDETFARLFQKLVQDPEGTCAERNKAAEVYATSSKDSLTERYLDQIKAALIAYNRFGGLLSIAGTSGILNSQRDRLNTITELQAKMVAGCTNAYYVLRPGTPAPFLAEMVAKSTKMIAERTDSVLYAIAMLSPLIMAQKEKYFRESLDPQKLLDVIYMQSPYLGTVVSMEVLKSNFRGTLTPKPSLFCAWLLQHNDRVFINKEAIVCSDPFDALSGVAGYCYQRPNVVKEAFIGVNANTALLTALRRIDRKGVEQALKQGADVHANEFSERGTLAYVTQTVGKRDDVVEIVRMLLAHGASPDEQVIPGCTVLCFAKQPEVIRLLLDAGADINARDNDGKTPLFHAAISGSDFDKLRMLVERGADVHARNKNGEDVLDWLRHEYGPHPRIFEDMATQVRYLAAILEPGEANSAVEIIELSQQTRVEIKTRPPGAHVEIDGRPSGESPTTLLADMGHHEIRIGKRGYADQAIALEVQGEESVSLPEVTLLRKTGSLRVLASPCTANDERWKTAWADMRIGHGRSWRVRLPYTADCIPCGEWDVEVSVKGYRVESWNYGSTTGSAVAAILIDPDFTNEVTFHIAWTEEQPSVSGSENRKHPYLGQAWTNSLEMEFLPVPGLNVLVSRWETCQQDYEHFVLDTGRLWRKHDTPRTPTRPAVLLVWDDARAFCEWLTDREKRTGFLGENQRYRLPKAKEWNVAACVPLPPEAKKPDESFHLADSSVTIFPAGSFEPNRYGLYDMTGNAREWCEDAGRQFQLIGRVEQWSEDPRDRILLFGHEPVPKTGAVRGQRATTFSGDRGFRCVLEIASTEHPDVASKKRD